MIAQASALLLMAATIAVWFVAMGARAAARVQIRFAGILFLAMAAAAVAVPAVASSVVLLVMPIALTVLALACFAGFERALLPSLAAIALAFICLCGLAGAVTGFAAGSLAPAALAAAAIIVLSARQFDAARVSSIQGMLSAICFLAAASAFALEGVSTALLLFSTAGLLGLTLALSRSDIVVEKVRGRELRALPIRNGH